MGNVNDDTTWDTDEVERWLDNDEWLYATSRALARNAVTVDALAYHLAAEFTGTAIPNIDWGEVSWAHLAEQLWEEHHGN